MGRGGRGRGPQQWARNTAPSVWARTLIAIPTHWSARYDGELQIAFGGATPAEAVDRLVEFVSLDQDSEAL